MQIYWRGITILGAALYVFYPSDNLTYDIRPGIEVRRVYLMPERAVPYPAPTVAVVPVWIGPLEDHLSLRLGQILAQPLVLQEKEFRA